MAYDLFLDKESDLINGLHDTSPKGVQQRKKGTVKQDSLNPTEEIETSSLKDIQESAKILIHLELERSTTPAEMAIRMWEYQRLITSEHKNSLVLPIVVFFDNHLKGIEWSVFKKILCEEEIISFRYVRMGLKNENAEYWLKGKHPLMFALAIFMKYNRKQKPEMKVSILKTIIESDLTESQKVDLSEYVHQAFKLDANEETRFNQMTTQEPKMERVFLTSSQQYLKGVAEGVARGVVEGETRGLLNSIYKILRSQGQQINDDQKSIISYIQDYELLDQLMDMSLNQSLAVDQLVAIAQTHKHN